MGYIVRSPNSKLVKTKRTTSADEAAKYYEEQGMMLLRMRGAHNIKLEWLADEDLVRRITVLNEGADRCAIEVWVSGTNELGEPLYSVAELRPQFPS